MGFKTKIGLQIEIENRREGEKRRREEEEEEEEEKRRKEMKKPRSKRYGTNLGYEFLYEFPYNCMVISCTLT